MVCVSRFSSLLSCHFSFLSLHLIPLDPSLQEGKMSPAVADAVDYKGFPADRSVTGGWVPAALILGLSYDSSAHTIIWYIIRCFFFSLSLLLRLMQTASVNQNGPKCSSLPWPRPKTLLGPTLMETSVAKWWWWASHSKFDSKEFSRYWDLSIDLFRCIDYCVIKFVVLIMNLNRPSIG